jgi:hypothetical protein
MDSILDDREFVVTGRNSVRTSKRVRTVFFPGHGEARAVAQALRWLTRIVPGKAVKNRQMGIAVKLIELTARWVVPHEG